MKRKLWIIFWFLITILYSHLLFSYADIFEYIEKADETFKWEKVSQKNLSKWNILYEIKLISQNWENIVWQHRLRLIKPLKIENPELAILLITGSGKGTEELLYCSEVASETNSLVAILHDVPNQPIYGLEEDGLISYTFQKFLETKNENLPLLFPMTKSVVKAMDAIQQFSKKELDIDVSGFVVGGASKRGWTTWFSCAVDKRVKGIFPMVYDNLWLSKQMKHQIHTWGKYSEMISEYTERNLPQIIETKEGKELATLVDPFTYKDKILVPKFIILGTNDRYWPLDALNIYYDELIEEKYIYYAANSGHGLENNITKVIKNVIAFYLKIVGKLEFPKFSWECRKVKNSEGNEFIEFSIIPDKRLKPKNVFVWTASSKTKDFRDVIWQKRPIKLSDSKYVYKVKKPNEGYFALFGETFYETEYHQTKKSFFLSTNVYIYGE